MPDHQEKVVRWRIAHDIQCYVMRKRLAQMRVYIDRIKQLPIEDLLQEHLKVTGKEFK